MLRYVLRRFLLLIPMVLAASVIIFLMLRLRRPGARLFSSV